MYYHLLSPYVVLGNDGHDGTGYVLPHDQQESEGNVMEALEVVNLLVLS